MKPILGKILRDKGWLFFCPPIDAKTWHRGFCLYFSDLQSYKRPIKRGFKISAWMRQSSATSNTLWACVIFWGQITVQRYFVFVSTVGLLTSLYEQILWMNLEKKRTYACTFPVQRKEINVVKVCFTMRYSSRKLSHEKVITTAYNFWRQIACSFLVKSGNVLLLGKKNFEIPPFFQTRPGDLGENVHACSLRFSALNVGSLWLIISHITFRDCRVHIFPTTFLEIAVCSDVLCGFSTDIMTSAKNCKPIHANGKTHRPRLPSWKLNHSNTLISYF